MSLCVDVEGIYPAAYRVLWVDCTLTHVLFMGYLSLLHFFVTLDYCPTFLGVFLKKTFTSKG